ncbi:AraC family transcriptional regulator [Leptospira hartskeerlii]|uniref:AraC family transcriptional regulator n=1 Tax=Leptospira hartskeerlii TaxID=2023177 RepID=A0A2M9XEJ0_9LEPT|nr:helix-turn-helix domain-containing protein [Leptospira hartskeerlii]PJZ26108.1 AraC family transcriptional regulator [Leptospira hartskeerlii]PJZ34192.1 AraC family transcriptional regulator [Leptospira hartskeerlii]
MKVETFLPRKNLQPYIRQFLIIESESGMQNKILPGSSLVISFRINGSISHKEENRERILPSSGITGLRRFPRLIEYSPKASTLLVIFKEGGAASFIREPIHTLFELNISLDHLISPKKVSETEEKLFQTKTNPEKISIVENFLISEWRGSKEDDLILNSIIRIRKSKGNLKIGDLLKGLPISRDSYEKRFREMIGTSPKQFSNLVRMRNIIDSYSSQITLTEVAQEAGYFDQAHFIKDFKTFTNETPKHFFKLSTPYW